MPSLATDSPLDYRIKKGIVVDIMKKLVLNIRRKYQYKAERKARLTENLMKPRNLTDEKADGFKEDHLKNDQIK